MTIQEVVASILNGDNDDYFDNIYDAIRQRKKILTTIKAAAFQVGDVVKLVNIKPKYMAGATGRITGRKNTKFVVALDVVSSRFGGEVVCGAALLETV